MTLPHHEIQHFRRELEAKIGTDVTWKVGLFRSYDPGVDDIHGSRPQTHLGVARRPLAGAERRAGQT